jgi:hypothetical protein
MDIEALKTNCLCGGNIYLLEQSRLQAALEAKRTKEEEPTISEPVIKGT